MNVGAGGSRNAELSRFSPTKHTRIASRVITPTRAYKQRALDTGFLNSARMVMGRLITGRLRFTHARHHAQHVWPTRVEKAPHEHRRERQSCDVQYRRIIPAYTVLQDLRATFTWHKAERSKHKLDDTLRQPSRRRTTRTATPQVFVERYPSDRFSHVVSTYPCTARSPILATTTRNALISAVLPVEVPPAATRFFRSKGDQDLADRWRR
jgi:hypothetical protein